MAVSYPPGFRTPPVGKIRGAVYVETVGIQFLNLGWKELMEQFVVASKHFLIDFGREVLVESPIF